jgi:diguanylate cyclase (GGDEF)-like protein
MQAALLLMSSLVIGAGLSAWEMRSALKNERQTMVALTESMLDLVDGSAANAVWALDPTLAHEVLEGIITTQPGMQSIEIRADIRNNAEETLARLENTSAPMNTLICWIAAKYFDDITMQSRRLSVINLGVEETVGTITIELSSQFAASKFLSQVYTKLWVGLLEVVLIGFALLILTQWFITAPLRKAAIQIAQMGPESLDEANYSLPIPRLHKSDELGQLLDHINKLFDRLVDSRKELRRLATRDPLTNLPNRTLIQEHLMASIAAAARGSSHVAVIFLDLDRFKKVNDSLGHKIGDRLLQRVAQTLIEQLREEDSVGRLGGDEFLIILPVDEVKTVIEVVRRITTSLTRSFQIEGHSLRASASLGISIYPEDGNSADVLIGRADLAMYKAKSDPSTKWHLFSKDLSKAVDTDLALETALSNAIAQDELAIHLQPQFYAKEKQLAACEALLRWTHNGRSIPPEKFIAIAETSGLILEIGDWVIEQTCKILHRWSDKAIPISVNVSGHQMSDANFVSRTLDIVRRYGVKPELITFEITETVLMHNLDESFNRLSRLRDEGFHVSIDDFGTGYSSLSYLTRLPIDEFKIDRSFVSGSQHSSVVLSTIVAMGRALNIHVVAEGVETDAQRKELADCGCDLLQGYLLGRPVPVAEFELHFKMPETENIYPITSC